MRRFGNMPSGRNGLTLIEVLIAFAILSFCMTSLSLLVLSGKKMSDIARDHYAAVNIAKSHLERARSINFRDLHQMAESDVRIDDSGYPDPNGRLRRTTTVSFANDILADMTVMVEIQDRVTMAFSGEHETVRSYIANTGTP